MSTAQERLFGGYYNSAGFSGANPGGLANGGHVQNFPAALQDIGTVAQAVGVQSAAATTAAAAAGTDRAAVAADRTAVQQLVGNLPAGVIAQGQPEIRSGGSGKGSVVLRGGEPTFTGYVEFVNAENLRYGYIGFASTAGKQIVFATGNGGSFYFNERPSFAGSVPFDAANDGSGSGLDADLLRGRAPSLAASADTVPLRGGDGSSEFKTLYLVAGGGIAFTAIGVTMNVRDSNTVQLNSALYLSAGLSASDVTQRSDRRLKRDISDLGPVERLRPRRYVLKENGEQRLGFIAQEVADVCPLAVRRSFPFMEVEAMALIAHLSQQLNDALDRIDALEAAR